MAIVDPDRIGAQLTGLSELPVARQLGVLVGIAASVALGVWIVLWSQQDQYALLFGKLSDSAAAEIVDQLRQSGVPYRLDARTGALEVPVDQLHETRLALAASGLPRERASGYELIADPTGFGGSKVMEAARLKHVMETELARSIATIAGVQAARVHLAMPEPSVFVRERRQPSASVVLTLDPGARIDPKQVSAVAHLVGASVPGLTADAVKVIDQGGRLVSPLDDAAGGVGSMAQLDYANRLEETYVRRIEDLLSPMLGYGRIRAQVSAQLDFSVVEATIEDFEGDPNVVVSEQTLTEESESQRRGGGGGVPGALANTPAGPPGAAAGDDQTESSSVRETTRNFELDRTIRTVRSPVGRLERLSVAVVVDDVVGVDEETGEAIREPLSPERIAELTALVENAVGFDAARGDRVQVVGAPFRFEVAEPVAELPLWRQPEVLELAREAAGVLGVLFLVFGVLRPFMRSLEPRGAAQATQASVEALPLDGSSEDDALGADRLTLSGPAPEQLRLSGPEQYQERVVRAQGMVTQDPRLAARVVKDWVAADG
ncbi:MAG: flagellar basal-body MS-ring/collar protein FliF [Pseudomonadales bacterium]|jgi:flagellar M-ring protein FliF|nr:flagellar basal-body MS-ring/collar protein FliF [Pseudomonadales bacterium]